ncbi:MAG: hypothetical protein J5998_12545 [Clostridia bacterium]|nr:hypothetical protein [Clostridia bacterium]
MFRFIRDHDRTAFKWAASCALAALALITALAGWSMTHYSFGGERLALRRIEENRAVMADASGHEAVLTGSGSIPTVGRDSELTYGDLVIRRRFDESDFAYVYTFSDGSEASVSLFAVTADGQTASDGLTELQRAEFDLFGKMQAYLESGNPVWRYVGKNILMASIALLGLAMLCFPESAWRVQHKFSVRGGEPTDWAIFSNQATGVFFAAVSLVLACVRF